MKKLILFILIFLLMLNMAACGESESMHEIEELAILCSNFPAYDFCRQIAGDRINVELLIPPGSDSHSFEPTARDIIKISKWFVVCNGGENESWLEDIISTESLRYEPLYMMDCVAVLEEEHKEGMQNADHKHEAHEHGEDCDHGHGEEMEYDEHVWTSPVNAAAICESICDRLCEIKPEDSDYFRERLSAYLQELYALDASFREIASTASHDTLVFADRFPVRYFVEEYGFDYYAAFPGCAAETEASAKTVAFLIDRVKEDSLPAVFYIEFSNEKMADIICEDTGCRKLQFHSAHNVSASDFEAGISYLDIMYSNLESLKEAVA